jgi:hypothetical protein
LVRHQWPQFEGEADRKVLEWRADTLMDVGLSDDQAAFLAWGSVDLHYAVKVVKGALAKGHSTEVAFQILHD